MRLRPFLIISILIMSVGLSLGWIASEYSPLPVQVQEEDIQTELNENSSVNERARGNIGARLEQLAASNPEFAVKISAAINDAGGDQEKLRTELQALLRENPQLAEEFRALPRSGMQGSTENQNRPGRNRSQ